MVINKLASGYGDIAVAALGIVKKIEMLPMSLCQGMLPLGAYNYASKNLGRMKEGSGRPASAAWVLLCSTCWFLSCVHRLLSGFLLTTHRLFPWARYFRGQTAFLLRS